jgi:K+-transporting ATPase ATPase C chain
MLATYGSNLGPEAPALIKAIKQRKAEIAEREGVPESAVPPDAVTASGSGLDPDISVAYAELQVPRVARATGLSEAAVRQLVDEHTAGRTWGVLGEPHVNVLELDIAVQQAAARG